MPLEKESENSVLCSSSKKAVRSILMPCLVVIERLPLEVLRSFLMPCLVVIERFPIEVNNSNAYGSVVWAKWNLARSYTWWPATIIRPSDCQQKEPKIGYIWVFWFGDHQISQVSKKDITSFAPNFDDFFQNIVKKKHFEALYEALEALAIRSNIQFDSREEHIDWARNGFNGINTICLDLPTVVVKHLVRRKELSSSEEFNYADYQLSQCRNRVVLNKVRTGELQLENFCIGCYKEESTIQHPLFKCGLCYDCKTQLLETIYAIGEDGKNICCVLCGTPGNLIVCDNIECQCSYCLSCIATLLDETSCKTILEATPWFCFLCPQSSVNCDFLQKRDNWEESLSLFFKPDSISDMLMPSSDSKRPIRVLSLFDGISTGKLALDKLGIITDSYFASEIDENAIHISKFHHGSNITYIGDVKHLTEERIKSMCPIDLVIGGSPCNDLSLVNPKRKGLFDLTGTGCLFFDYFHVLKIVQRLNKDRHVFFLFENVAAMKLETKRIISQFLMCQPVLIDAKYFSAQNRARYFWGNIPSMYAHNKVNYSEDNTLNNYVLKELGRKAIVNKIRTVTTQSNSVRGKMTVEMNGEPDCLWITELERVFGFPMHYTDCANLSTTKRQELLGRAWSLQVIEKILSPLQNFFLKY